MKIRKTFCLIVLQVVIVLCLTGCGKDSDVVFKDAMKDFIEVTAKFNMPESPEDMKDKFPRITTSEGSGNIFKGYENLTEEKLTQEYYNIIERSNSGMSYFNFNDEQLKRIADARLKLLKKLDYSLDSEESDKAGCVIVSVKALDSIAMERALEKNVMAEIIKKHPNFGEDAVISVISMMSENLKADVAECVCTAITKVCENPIFLDDKEKAYIFFVDNNSFYRTDSLPDIRTIFWVGAPVADGKLKGYRDSIHMRDDKEDLLFESGLFHAWCENGAKLAYSEFYTSDMHIKNVNYFYRSNVELASGTMFNVFSKILENVDVNGNILFNPSEVNTVFTRNEQVLDILRNEYDKLDHTETSELYRQNVTRIKDKFGVVISELEKLNNSYKTYFSDDKKKLSQSEMKTLSRETSETYIHYRNFESWDF